MTSPTRSAWALRMLAALLAVAILGLFAAWVAAEDAIAPRPAAAATNREAPTSPPTASAATTPHPATPRPNESRESAAEPEAMPAATASTALLYGIVRDSAGNAPISGSVELSRADERIAFCRLTDGTFAFSGLVPGTYRALCRAENELPLEREITVAAPATRVDLELDERWVLTVEAVTPAGKPLRDEFEGMANFRLTRALAAAAFPEPLAGTLPLSDRQYASAGLGTFAGNRIFRMRAGEKAKPTQVVGTLTLPPHEPVHVVLLLRSTVLAQAQATPGQEQLTFAIDAEAVTAALGSVQLRVVDPSGAGIHGVKLALNGGWLAPENAASDHLGRIRADGVIPGVHRLSLRHADVVGPALEVPVESGSAIDLGDIVMRPGFLLRIDMRNFEGEGRVRYTWLDPGPAGTIPEDSFLSNNSMDEYPLMLLPGRYGFLATAENGAAVVEFDLAEAPTEPVRFDLRPAGPLRITYDLGPASAKLELSTKSGLVIRRYELTGTNTTKLRLPPDTYIATITDMTGNVERRSVAVSAAGGTLEIP